MLTVCNLYLLGFHVNLCTMSTICTKYVQCMYTASTHQVLHVHCMYTVCKLYVYCIYTVCILYVHCMYTVCTLYVHCMYTVCILYVYCMYTVCTLYVHCMYCMNLPIDSVLLSISCGCLFPNHFSINFNSKHLDIYTDY